MTSPADGRKRSGKESVKETSTAIGVLDVTTPGLNSPVALQHNTDMGVASQRVLDAFDAIATVNRPEVWITLRAKDDVLADAQRIDERVASGDDLPLAGILLAVKDNIDVAGLPTTAACPEYSYTPASSAVAVTRLLDAGAIVVGKTNLDQFATGLVGTRSPYGAVRNAAHPDYISGGSSSGSAVAVALGIVDVALGTDTAGSGRVPAALNAIVGIKPTLGLVPADGVVPACIDYDTITVFARSLPLATSALGVMAGPDPSDPRSRRAPADTPLGVTRKPVLAIALPEQLDALCPSYRDAWGTLLETLADHGFTVVPVNIEPLLDAARLLYDGAIVAERYSAVGAFIDQNRAAQGLDATVAAIIAGAATKTAAHFVDDLNTLRHAAAYATEILTDVDGLLLPTTTEHPTIAAVQADPVAINRRMGTYTNFCNLLDLSAVAVPAPPTHDGMPFGVMVIEPAFADQIALDVANKITSAVERGPLGDVTLPMATTGAVLLAVFGAHRRGAPLHHELEAINARYLEHVATTDAYRLYALDTTPPKPGVVRVEHGGGQPITGELYAVSPAGLGSFLAQLPAPMALTAVELNDGRTVTGFTCTHDSVVGASDITQYRDWLTYLSASSAG